MSPQEFPKLARVAKNGSLGLGREMKTRLIMPIMVCAGRYFPSGDDQRDFHQFLGDKLKDGRIDWSPEEALDEWRRLHPDGQAPADDLAAIQEVLADLAKSDRGVPFEEFDRDFRQRHNLPQKNRN
jgi:hypothetical protein